MKAEIISAKITENGNGVYGVRRIRPTGSKTFPNKIDFGCILCPADELNQDLIGEELDQQDIKLVDFKSERD